MQADRFSAREKFPGSLDLSTELGRISGEL
jgi:hypothetical protein